MFEICRVPSGLVQCLTKCAQAGDTIPRPRKRKAASLRVRRSTWWTMRLIAASATACPEMIRPVFLVQVHLLVLIECFGGAIKTAGSTPSQPTFRRLDYPLGLTPRRIRGRGPDRPSPRPRHRPDGGNCPSHRRDNLEDC